MSAHGCRPAPCVRRQGESMSKSPAFQFYPKDWLSSLNITLMSPEQEGGYIRLLCYCWDSGDCSLPADETQLIAMSRLSKGGWEMVAKCFIPHPEKEGYLTNERLYAELVKQRAWSRKSSIGGKKSAAQRIVKQKNLKGGSQMVGEWYQPKGNIASASASAKKEESKDLPRRRK